MTTVVQGLRCVSRKPRKVFSPEDSFVKNVKSSFYKAVVFLHFSQLKSCLQLGNVFVHKTQCKLLCPKSTQKFSGLSRNACLVSGSCHDLD